MEEVWICHLQEIALDDDWVTVTDVMGREYRIDPQVAMVLALWCKCLDSMAHAHSWCKQVACLER